MHRVLCAVCCVLCCAVLCFVVLCCALLCCAASGLCDRVEPTNTCWTGALSGTCSREDLLPGVLTHVSLLFRASPFAAGMIHARPPFTPFMLHGFFPLCLHAACTSTANLGLRPTLECLYMYIYDMFICSRQAPSCLRACSSVCAGSASWAHLRIYVVVPAHTWQHQERCPSTLLQLR